MKPGRLLFASIHCYLDPASGAALCSREVLELLASRGWDCRALTCGILDYQGETSVDELLSKVELDGAARRMSAALPRGGAAEVVETERMVGSTRRRAKIIPADLRALRESAARGVARANRGCVRGCRRSLYSHR